MIFTGNIILFAERGRRERRESADEGQPGGVTLQEAARHPQGTVREQRRRREESLQDPSR